MPPTDLASLKWEDDGELSSQDTNLVRGLQEQKRTRRHRSTALVLKHSHAKKKNKSLTSRSEVDIQAH